LTNLSDDANRAAPDLSGIPVEPDCFGLLATPAAPGALAVIDLLGNVEEGVARLWASRPPRLGSVALRPFGDFDEGIVAVLSPDRGQLFPHGGPRVLERLQAWLAAHGIGWLEAATDLDPLELFPEASDPVEAYALAALTRASSPLAAPLLLRQSELWQACPPSEADRPRAERLRRLLVPPRVAVVGPPNAGKSTLSNAVVGRTMSIPSPEPGTTRDYVAARIDVEGLAVDWYDTPGIRVTVDPLEQKAIDLARTVIALADLVVAVAEPGTAWLGPHELGGRVPDLRVRTKADLLAAPDRGADAAVSAASGAGIPELAALIRERLVPRADIASERPWLFDDRLLARVGPRRGE
jgi:hypothetical protein